MEEKRLTYDNLGDDPRLFERLKEVTNDACEDDNGGELKEDERECVGKRVFSKEDAISMTLKDMTTNYWMQHALIHLRY